MVCEQLKFLKNTEKSKVWLVYSKELGKIAVEKRLSGKLYVYERLKSINHRYLPKIYDVRFEADDTIVVEEYISGGSLAGVNAGEKQVCRWLLETCEVLGFLHGKGILHRDIKPSNILLGSDGHIRLIDFDAAREKKEDREDLDRDTRLLGTRGYAPPEQYGFSQTDERADIYALGITFRELLGLAAKKRRWKGILKRCTELEPKRRYRYTWQIKLAIYAGRIRRRIIYPILVLIPTVFIAFMAWSYITDSDVRMALDIVLSSDRDLIFSSADIDTLKNSKAEMQKFNGNDLDMYTRLYNVYPDKIFISTGYSNEGGLLLFGGFSAEFNISTGKLHYSSFDGLYYIDNDYNVGFISPENCYEYAPAVLELYGLDIFDTPLL